MGILNKLFGRKKEPDFPPKPKWRPNLPIDIDLIFEKTKYYTGEKIQFAIFQYGTVTYFGNQIENIEKSAIETLDRIYNFHPDFNPIPMDDGNYLIKYSQPAFTIVFENEIKSHWSYIERNHLDGICPEEVLINAQGQSNVFDDIGKISLFGRSKMFMDAQAPLVVKTYDPNK